MKLRVLYVYQGDWPRNATRVWKQTRALAEAGHTVRLLAGNPRDKPRREASEWMDIERVPMLGPRAVNRYLGFPVFVNPFWVWQIWRAARRFRADCLVVRDLPLAPAVLAVGRALGLPVHYEMADVYPVAMRANRSDHPSLISRVTRHPGIAEWLDGVVLRRVDSVFVVSAESRERCLGMGVAPEAVAVVGNTPAVLPDLQRSYPLPTDLAGWADRVVVLFLGNLLADRGLLDAIESIARIGHAAPAIALAIIGDGREQERLARRIAQLGVDDSVRLLGWKDQDEHAAYYHHAAIGILPFHDTEHINITLANKLFDYMAAGLPVVASDVRPMRRVLGETGAGVLVPPGDIDALGRALTELARDPERRQRLGARGRWAVEHDYSWEKDREQFLAAVLRAGGRR